MCLSKPGRSTALGRSPQLFRRWPQQTTARARAYVSEAWPSYAPKHYGRRTDGTCCEVGRAGSARWGWNPIKSNHLHCPWPRAVVGGGAPKITRTSPKHHSSITHHITPCACSEMFGFGQMLRIAKVARRCQVASVYRAAPAMHIGAGLAELRQKVRTRRVPAPCVPPKAWKPRC